MESRKSNILRCVFWGFITIVLLSAGIFGVVYKNDIFNSRKDELNSIITIFKNTNVIKNYESMNTKIDAQIKGKDIVITFNGSIQEEYLYKLKNGYLETRLEKNDSIGNMLLMILTDSIAINKGQNEGEIYSMFTNNLIYDYKLDDGIEYKLKDNYYIVKINLDKYVLKQYDSANNNNFLDKEKGLS